MPRFSIVTICKGRLEHLRQSLPRALAQPDTEVIVVDYDCPDQTAAVVGREFPAARVVKVEDQPLLSVSRARNLGAAAAQGEWLIFLDADIVVAADFVARLTPLLAEQGRLYRFAPSKGRATGIYGSCVMSRADYAASGGYDEAIECYGGEDNDLYFRLNLAGLTTTILDADLIDLVVPHDDATRVRFTRYQSKLMHQRVNSAYLLVKGSLLRQLGADGLSEAQCRQLYDLIRDIVEQARDKPDQPVHFTLDLPPDPDLGPLPGWDCVRHLVFDLQPKNLVVPDSEDET